MIFTKGATTLTLLNVLYPVNRTPARIQTRGVSLDGTTRVYDFQSDSTFLVLNFRINHSQLTDVRSFIETTVKFSRETFQITPDTDQNWGEGDDQPIVVRYWSDNYLESQQSFQRYFFSMVFKLEQELGWGAVDYVDDIDEMLGGWGGN